MLSYQVAFILNFLVCYSAMKMASWLFNRERNFSFKDFVFSPYFSVRSLNYRQCRDHSLYIRFLTFSFLTVTFVVLAHEFLNPLSFFEILIFSPAIYFFTEMLGAFGQIIFYKKKTFPIHRKPLTALSLSHFWGRDWNIWIQDWLRDITQTKGSGKHHRRIVLVFFVSGTFHELMCNLPYWLMYRESYFGTMIAYFIIQGVALWIDKKFISHMPPIYRRIYLWAAVVLPSPLFINVPLLTFFGLTHG